MSILTPVATAVAGIATGAVLTLAAVSLTTLVTTPAPTLLPPAPPITLPICESITDRDCAGFDGYLEGFGYFDWITYNDNLYTHIQ